ncbi:hypothetical protein [Pyxidicoccus xibeiensis]|uniref:hypothetical protein n=1 Tax=Pyxidicoccus xibeiensis TaxID=2906759 RepID=UPI0020A80A2A|nr:hypothetical protein [Pyxidicoccus xibeiensis]MCP3135782.1 hypothetical protein [Pyxidicoccus xibeiensis]
MSSGSPFSFVHVLLVLALIAVLWFFTSRARRERHEAWSTFAARNDWVFSKSKEGGMEIQGLHQERQLSVLTESRHGGNGHRIVTVVRLELGDALPPELTLEPEGLGDRFMKLFGVKDEEVGDAELDEALDLQHVTPESRAVLRNPRVRERVLALRDAYKRFSIVGGLLEAEQDGVPDTVAELDTLVAPAFALSRALDEAAGLSPEERVVPA